MLFRSSSLFVAVILRKSVIMPKKLSLEVDVLVRQFSRENLSFELIRKKLIDIGHKISKKTVANIVNCIGERQNHNMVGLPPPKKPHPRQKATKAMIRKIDMLTDKENPPSIRSIANRLHISHTTVLNVIHQDLNKKKRSIRYMYLKSLTSLIG